MWYACSKSVGYTPLEAHITQSVSDEIMHQYALQKWKSIWRMLEQHPCQGTVIHQPFVLINLLTYGHMQAIH